MILEYRSMMSVQLLVEKGCWRFVAKVSQSHSSDIEIKRVPTLFLQ